MEGNFLSRYKNKLDEWSKRIEDEPHNKNRHQSDMSDYIIKCMPYMNSYVEDTKEETNTDNAFNAVETNGIKRKDIFTDYLIDVEKKNIYRHMTKRKKSVHSVCIVISSTSMSRVTRFVIHVA